VCLISICVCACLLTQRAADATTHSITLIGTLLKPDGGRDQAIISLQKTAFDVESVSLSSLLHSVKLLEHNDIVRRIAKYRSSEEIGSD